MPATMYMPRHYPSSDAYRFAQVRHLLPKGEKENLEPSRLKPVEGLVATITAPPSFETSPLASPQDEGAISQGVH